MLKQKVYHSISNILGSDKFSLLTPKNPDHGDFALYFPTPGVEERRDGKTPGVNLEKFRKNDIFEKIEQKGNFINFFISKKILIEEMNKILEDRKPRGLIKTDKPLRINFEFGQPNTHKLPHIGHLFSYIYGESCCRLLEAAGHKVFRTNYQGDIGLHVAKCLYQVTRNKLQVTKLKTLEDKVEFLQKCYQEGSKLYEEEEKAKEEIDNINKQIYLKSPEIVDLWRETREWSVEYYKEFEKRLGIAFDQYYFEGEVAQLGVKTVKANLGKIFEESDGAVIFPGEKYGLHNRVFLNRFGNPTYEAKDLGLVQQKYQDWQFDRCIITTAREQNEYWQVVKKAIIMVQPEIGAKITHIGYGMINLKSGKMSSRAGTILSAMDLIDLVIKEVEKINPETAEIVALAAIKYSFLKSEAKKNITFDIKESISIHGNSGPYLLYTYARCQSVLMKRETGNMKHETIRHQQLTIDNEELSLLRSFFRFPEVVHDAATNYSPHLICNYLYDHAQKFNLFYEKCPILKADEEVRNFRLRLAEATAQVLKNGLHLLGIGVLNSI